MTNNNNGGAANDYAAALRFLEEQTKFGINLGLARIERLLALLGNPEKQGVKYLHIGGTNGKGSVSAMLWAMMLAAEKNCGLFTSPHLHTYRERYRINGELIARDEVVCRIAEIKPLLAQMVAEGSEAPTEFEVSTALALKYFADKKAEYAVMEVGLGGEIDSTNVINPEIVVITNVAIDHIDYLGGTVAEIAKVKAGIIKAGKPCVTCAEDAAAKAVLRARAEAVGAPIYCLGDDFAVENATFDETGQVFTFVDERNGERLEGLRVNLLGAHQLKNAAAAVATARLLGLPEVAIRTGLANARWPGRLEVVSREPLVVLDGAHNEAGMQALAAAIKTYWPGRKICAVLGMLADKQRKEALSNLLPLLDRAIICKVPSYRAGDWETLGDLCREYNVPYELIEDVPAAVAAGRAELLKGADMLLVSGSLYMLADARACLVEVESDE